MSWQRPTLLPTRRWQNLAITCLLTLAYFSTAQLAYHSLGLRIEASPVWPPAGIALAAVLLAQRVWLGVALGAFLFALSLKVSWAIAFGSTVGSTLQAIVGATLLGRLKFHPSLERLPDVFQLVVLGAWVSPLIGATISTLVGYQGGFVDSYNWGQNWWTFWLGDSMGILVVTPLILLSRDLIGTLPLPIALRTSLPNFTLLDLTNRVKRKISAQAEAVTCFSLLCVISWFVFSSETTNKIAQYPLEYLPFTCVIWAALRFAQRGAVVSSLLISIIAIWGAIQGGGPFVAKAGEIDQGIRFLQCFLGVVTLTGLILAATKSERARAVDLLKEREASLANAQRLARIGNWDFISTYGGTTQQQLRWSDELYRLFGFTPKVFAPSWEMFFQRVHPEDRKRVETAISGALRDNQAYCLDYRIVLPDGLERVVCEQVAIYQEGLSGTVQDVTERKQVEAQLVAAAAQITKLNTHLESQVEERTQELRAKMTELQELNQLKDVFLQAVSHDLRTCLLGMSMVLKNLSKAVDDNI